jgi:hypothetical protein
LGEKTCSGCVPGSSWSRHQECNPNFEEVSSKRPLSSLFSGMLQSHPDSHAVARREKDFAIAHGAHSSRNGSMTDIGDTPLEQEFGIKSLISREQTCLHQSLFVNQITMQQRRPEVHVPGPSELCLATQEIGWKGLVNTRDRLGRGWMSIPSRAFHLSLPRTYYYSKRQPLRCPNFRRVQHKAMTTNTPASQQALPSASTGE